MTAQEGRGFVLRATQDCPWAGWAGSRFLEEGLASVHAAPGRALARLMNLAALLPGGFGLIWDHPPAWMQSLPPESRQGWWEAITAIPHLTLHLGPEAAQALPGGAFRGWVHAPDMPDGNLGEHWRQGVLGWVPATGKTWQLPDLGVTAAGDEVPPGWLWGEVSLALGALSTLGSGEALVAAMSEAQGLAERGLAQRLSSGAWVDLPFSRRAVGWRLSLVGGAEFLRAGGTWPQALGQLRALKALLQERLRTPIHLGACSSFQVAAQLGRQALREGLPWRASLPLPPAPGAFTPGLAADPRDPVPLEARTMQPAAWSATLDHPPVALLRVPAVPSEAGAQALLGQIQPAPAWRWLPPDLPPPGPFDPDRPWTSAAAFPFPADPGNGVQRGLFEDFG
ncbi:hypothetical protein [Geothrix sp. PMB-07]|uniref:hypothetical protein n=1 Tax=Geothrix sp. PMB-07 TaxID=3068640 RepID=UPI002741F2D5|nr:hypothetical protein [Geothrix sp. PMB-07]WLT30239.1 hypothetical protein Q9293_10965 [Geothrix sp. PMB-07]